MWTFRIAYGHNQTTMSGYILCKVRALLFYVQIMLQLMNCWQALGKYALQQVAEVYSKSGLLETHSVTAIRSLKCENHVMSKVNLNFRCCEELGAKFNISSIHFNTALSFYTLHIMEWICLPVVPHRTWCHAHKQKLFS